MVAVGAAVVSAVATVRTVAVSIAVTTAEAAVSTVATSTVEVVVAVDDAAIASAVTSTAVEVGWVLPLPLL